jgi:hypothetical protein
VLVFVNRVPYFALGVVDVRRGGTRARREHLLLEHVRQRLLHLSAVKPLPLQRVDPLELIEKPFLERFVIRQFLRECLLEYRLGDHAALAFAVVSENRVE